MAKKRQNKEVARILRQVMDTSLQPLDLLPHTSMMEKLVDLVLQGVPAGPPQLVEALRQLADAIIRQDSSTLNVVVFGGGTGLSNAIGGDSRKDDWPDSPFRGMKELFPRTTAVVCITDDGGSTGELLKDLDIIGLGDLRHVLLSSVQERLLRQKYGIDHDEALRVTAILHRLFNLRFEERPLSREELSTRVAGLEGLPEAMAEFFNRLLAALFAKKPLCRLLERQHCLGNLLLASAMYLAGPLEQIGHSKAFEPSAIIAGVDAVAEVIGADPQAVLPCTTTPAQLKILYANGVLVTGEVKSSQAHRNCPVDRVFVEFARQPQVPRAVFDAIAGADLIVFAPGSLYTSIIPVLQVPDLADAVRANSKAVKILVANLWAQRGETDLVSDDPKRRFYVSDLIRAYQRNIPGDLTGLFREILTLSLKDIKGSVCRIMRSRARCRFISTGSRSSGRVFFPLRPGSFQNMPWQSEMSCSTIRSL